MNNNNIEFEFIKLQGDLGTIVKLCERLLCNRNTNSLSDNEHDLFNGLYAKKLIGAKMVQYNSYVIVPFDDESNMNK